MAAERNWLKWVGIGCGSLLVLGIVAGVALFSVVRAATAGPEKVAKDFLAAAATGEVERAYEYFSAPLQESQPLEAFRAAVAANPSLFDVIDTTFSDRSADLNGAKLAGTVELRAGTQLPASFTFVRENETWKLLGYHLGSTD